MKGKNTPDPLQNFINASVDDFLSLTDAEILKEVRDGEEDPEELAAEMQRLAQQAIMEHGRGRFARARAQLASRKLSGGASRLTNLSLAEKERVIGQFSANDPRLRGRLTLAARMGHGASEQEIDGVLEDLIELGVIDEAGNPQ
ncbi:MAG: hypothetical protein JSR86_14575 [Proteobacteria bacterium]|nr:hypothetical protein [Pseudomonadota bacterium]